MTAGYSITLARPGDVQALPAIELAAARLLEGHAPESVLNQATDLAALRAAQAAGRLWVALAYGVPVGFAIVEMLADGLPHLEEIDVHPSHGRRGLGTLLVRAVCEWAGRSGFAGITLTTNRDVRWNMPFYSRMGFTEIPAGRIRAALAEVVDEETARGLDPAARVAMVHRCKTKP